MTTYVSLLKMLNQDEVSARTLSVPEACHRMTLAERVTFASK